MLWVNLGLGSAGTRRRVSKVQRADLQRHIVGGLYILAGPL